MYERVAAYHYFAETFGWTPDQVDELPRWFRTRVAGVHRLVLKVREEQREREEREAQREAERNRR